MLACGHRSWMSIELSEQFALFEIEYRGTISRWLPNDPAVVRKYESDLLTRPAFKKGVCTREGGVNEKQLSLVILEFKNVIEEDAEIFRDFHEMFDQVPPNPDPNQPTITNYMRPLAVLTAAPTYDYTSPFVSGVPMYGVLAPFCNTEDGYRAFTNPKVNEMFHKIFEE